MKKNDLIIISIITALFICPILPSSILQAQNVAINQNGSAAHPSSLLDISSNSKGILIPRLMTLERTGIANPAEGLMVFDSVTKSFWYYSSGWKEIVPGGNNGVQNGNAGGDLSGTYPTPNVVKLQNLDLAPGIPYDRQVLKWDMVNNTWKGMNDSLFLPYNGSFQDPEKLFAITNTSLSNGGTAIYGQRTNTGSGILPPISSGVWGDNTSGAGVMGTSLEQNGVLGIAVKDHGVKGISTSVGKSGVYGKNDASDSYGVMGEIFSTGAAVYGKTAGEFGSAGLFANTNTINETPSLIAFHAGKGYVATVSNTEQAINAAVKVENNGTGNALLINSLNAAVTTPALQVNNNGKGMGINTYLPDPLSTADAISTYTVGSGNGIYASSNKGIAGRFYSGNANNENETVNATTYGKGSAGVFVKNNILGSISDVHKPAVLIDNTSKGNALKVISLHSPSVQSGVDIHYDGQAFGLNVNSTKGGIHAISTGLSTGIVAENYSGGMAIKGIADGYETAAIHGENNGNFGMGVLGSSTNLLGVGVKGKNLSDQYGAVQGENSGGGGGVRGISTGSFGAGVIGETGNNGGSGVAGKFISHNQSTTAGFTLWALNYSLGGTIVATINNAQNDNSAIEVSHGGTGNLALFKNIDGERVTISNNGNIKAAGTITVKNNKGIVRSSTSAQIRMETLGAQLIYFNMPAGASTTVNVNFATAFSAPPVVSLGNIQSGYTGPCEKMTINIRNVTTTGCTVTMYNSNVSGNPTISGTWNLLAVGAE